MIDTKTSLYVCFSIFIPRTGLGVALGKATTRADMLR
jgi:hypothetical protein